MENYKCIFEKVKKDGILYKGKIIEILIYKCSICKKLQIINLDDCKLINLLPNQLKELGIES
jgi:hypothetical protein